MINKTLATYTYDQQVHGTRSSVGFYNSAGASYAYDPFVAPSTVTQNFPTEQASPYNPAASVAYSYTTDQNGRRTGMTIADGTTSGTSAFAWQPGTLATTTYTVNDLNQYTAVATKINNHTTTVNPTYDAKGNLTYDGTNTYTWDYRNRLLTATSATNTASYTYDLFGRRSSKTVNGTVTTYLDDGQQEIAEYSGSGTLLRRFVYGPGVDEPIVMITVSSGQYLYHHLDGLGSIVATLDQNAVIVDQRGYSAYGEGTPSTGTPYGFTGRRYDPETGLYYYRARYYHPALGRFLSPDPKHAYASESTYAYVGNDPLNKTDPTGEAPVSVQYNGQTLTFDIDNQAIYNSVWNNPSSNLYGLNGLGILWEAGVSLQDPAGENVGSAGSMFAPDSTAVAAQQAFLNGTGTIASVLTVTNLDSTGSAPESTNGGSQPDTGNGSGSQNAGTSGSPGSGTSASSSAGTSAPAPSGSDGGASDTGLGGTLQTIASAIWNLPNTAIGIAVGVVDTAASLLAAPFTGQLPSFSFGNGALQISNLAIGSGGLTFGNVQLFGNADPASVGADGNFLGDHEGQHTTQGGQLGPLYLPSNILGTVAGLIFNGSMHGPSNWNEAGPQLHPPVPWP